MQVTPQDILVAVHCYKGDKHQVLELLPFFEHHKSPIVVVSPIDSQVHGIGPHITRAAGLVAYIGQKSWDRQNLQLGTLLEYPQKWFLLNDADSFVTTPQLPDYIFHDEDMVYGNVVNDFRVPGQSWRGSPPFPLDFHKGYPLIAIQPPYFLSRKALEKIVSATKDMEACPICPFIDWWWVPAIFKAGLKYARYQNCASCETVTPHGLAVMRERIVKDKAQFVHSIKSGAVARELVSLYKSHHG